MFEQKIEQYVLDHTMEQLDLLRALCAIPAPSHHEENRAAFCKAWLENIGATGVYIDEAKNVVFPLNCEGSNAITVIQAHTDTVFPDTEPMPYVDDGECIRCPGVGDDTACLVSLLLTAKFYVENQIKPQGGVLFVCNSCEEGLGNLKGTRQIFKTYAGRVRQFVSFDSGRLNHGTDACVGSHRYLVTVKTEGGHSFGKFGNENAIAALSKIVNAIYALEVPQAEGSKTTYNVGTITGGTSVNTIAQEAHMLCEYRSDNVDCLAIMQKHFAEIFQAAQSDKVDVHVELIGERPCASGVDQKEMDRLRALSKKLIREVTDTEVKFSSASTDCNIPLSIGVPAICIGSYNGGGAHTREEWLRKDSLPDGLRLNLRFALALTEE